MFETNPCLQGVSKTQTTDLENADLEKKKKRRTKGLKFITLASKDCFCVCDMSVFSRSLFARSAFSSSRKRRPRKRRPCKQRPRKHRRITNTLKNNSLCSRAYYGRDEFKSLIVFSFSFCYFLFCFQLFQICFQYPKVDYERCYRA